ncbi:hypothetical protein [Isoptericola sp. b408]|uniref:hypothetical protein n=1 Tax=Isoptericola sp. b408 TaxID=3064653 RepID=UPI002714127C|nr:hypothetical protein [Isoptericola sp. b408]MDO8152430.1 hypothetical protein [Isoptericola sp. b408]
MTTSLMTIVLADVTPGPSPSPTARVLEDWEVTPGLEGFLATFAVAVAAVLLFLSLSRHLRKADTYARDHGIEVPERRSIGIRRGAVDDGGSSAVTPTSPDVGPAPGQRGDDPGEPGTSGSPDGGREPR